MKNESERSEADHWRELAEMLGLPPEPHQAETRLPAAADEGAASNAEDVEEPVEDEVEVQEETRAWPSSIPFGQADDEEPDESDEIQPAEEEEAGGLTFAAAEELLFASPSSPSRVDEEEQVATGEIEEGAAPEGDAEPVKKARRGRRRRGRGKGQREPAADAAEQAELSEPAPDQEETGERGGRRRGGRRRKPNMAESEEVPVGEPARAPQVAEAAVEDDEDDEIEDLNKDWNVPTWAELIASLYRPER